MIKRIYTSNYAHCSDFELARAISVRVPADMFFKQIPSLAPTWEIVKGYKAGKITEEEYTEQYINLMKERHGTPHAIYNALPNGTILLCYEKKGQFCHRRVLANWIEEAMGVEIPEWESEKEVKKLDIVDSLLEF